MSPTAYLIAIAMLAGCADFGPFRAGGDDRPAGDGGTDASTMHDASITAPDGGMSGPVVLATESGTLLGLAAGGGYVYWGNAQQLHRVAATGGTVDILDAGGYVDRVAVRDDHVAWATPDAVWTANASFSSATNLATPGSLPGFVAASTDHVYYVRHTSTTSAIERIAWTGGAPEPLYTSLVTDPQVAVAGSQLYWSGYDTMYELRSSPLASPATFTTLTSTSNFASFDLLTAGGGSTVCWVDRPDINKYELDIWCWHNATKKRIATKLYQLFALAVTDTTVYYAARTNPTTAHLFRYRFTTAGTTTHDTSGPGPLTLGVATDGTYLYSLELTGSTYKVWRQPLP